ncbi:MAG TPA: VCBS repeat-containing protein, partial [Candidatus Saccharimonadales bacterium]|nr:VCBS repeat-containing protein [Candidatus Saccharimonadales bacterium]
NSSNTVSVLMNTGSGTFGAKTDYATGTGPRDIISTDFNGDGVPDLEVPNLSSTTVSVFLNNGSGTFGAKTDYATGTQPSGVISADFDGDTKPDLAVANNGAATVSVLLQSTVRLSVVGPTSLTGTLNLSGNQTISKSLTVAGTLYANGNIQATGSALFQNSVNSTTAFRIQNSSGTSLLTADTSGMTVSVGGALSVSGNVAVGGYLITNGGMYATSLPGSPVDGQEVYYIADNTNEIVWHLRYNASKTNWEYLGGSPLTIYVSTSESTSTSSGSSGYVDLTTVGPSITLPLAGTYTASFGAQASSSGRSGGAGSSITNNMKLNIGGTLSGPDATADTQLYSGTGTMNITEQIVQSYQFTAASASTNVKAQYQISAPFGSGSYSGTFSNRYLTITPVTVH